MKYMAAKVKFQYKPKVVHLLTTQHRAAMKDTANRDGQGNVVQKPEAILYDNKMEGVDEIDLQLHSIQVLKKTLWWHHKIFFRLLMMSLLSGH